MKTYNLVVLIFCIIPAKVFSSVTINNIKCLKGCPDNYDPICASNGMFSVIFPNKCEMEVENCNLKLRFSEVFKETRMSHCNNEHNNQEVSSTECPSVCEFTYKPICGTDGNEFRLFPNSCEMNVKNCKKEGSWKQATIEECRVYFEKIRKDIPEQVINIASEKICSDICTLEYFPICGTDGKEFITFGNKCEFENRNCKSRNKWTLVRTGEC